MPEWHILGWPNLNPIINNRTELEFKQNVAANSPKYQKSNLLKNKQIFGNEINPLAKEKIKKRLRNYFEMNDNKCTSCKICGMKPKQC